MSPTTQIHGFVLELSLELEANAEALRLEFASLDTELFVPWPDRSVYSGDWLVFPFVWSTTDLPADFDLDNNRRMCPTLDMLLSRYDRVCAAGISRLMPGCRVAPHRDRPKAGVLRYHLGLNRVIESALVLDGEEVTSVPGRGVLFDQSLEHSAHNLGAIPRDVLIIDYELDADEVASLVHSRGAIHFGPTADPPTDHLQPIVNEFRLLSPDDPHDLSIPNWSRSYEWKYVLSTLKPNQSVHNTCCGFSSGHKLFHDRLIARCPDTVNSDSVRRELNGGFRDFFEYDIRQPLNRSFDCVLCISTLEEIYLRDRDCSPNHDLSRDRSANHDLSRDRKSNHDLSRDRKSNHDLSRDRKSNHDLIQQLVLNLWAQVRPGGRMIVTCDISTPDKPVFSISGAIQLELLEEILGQACQIPSVPLSGANSIFPDPLYADLRICLIDLVKPEAPD